LTRYTLPAGYFLGAHLRQTFLTTACTPPAPSRRTLRLLRSKHKRAFYQGTQALRLGRSRAQGPASASSRTAAAARAEGACSSPGPGHSLAFTPSSTAAAPSAGTQREPSLTAGPMRLLKPLPTPRRLTELETHHDNEHPRSIWLILC